MTLRARALHVLNPPNRLNPILTDERLLWEAGAAAVHLARHVVEHELGEIDTVPEHAVPRKERGTFVTLREHGRLRGCMGLPTPEKPLPEAIDEAATMAAFKDPRFAAVTPDELDVTTFEVTVLTPPREIAPDDVEVGKHGLIIESDIRSGLLLPQVPVSQEWDREEFLIGICKKAGLPSESWKTETLKAFEGQVFRETEPRGPIEED